MPTFEFSFTGCKKGALGAHSHFTARRMAPTEQEALVALYDEYEHILTDGGRIVDESSCTYYLTRVKGVVELRQTRYREQFEAGREHPHDVCAVAGSKQRMRQLLTGWDSASIDWTTVPEDEQHAT